MRENLAVATRGPALRRLLAAARGAARRAHAPYSRFRVGAAVLTADGEVWSGFNVENASYPLGVCAERMTLARCRRHSRAPIVAVAIHTPTRAATAPCGLCRDALRRWARDAELVLDCLGGESVRTRVQDLLPAAGAQA